MEDFGNHPKKLTIEEEMTQHQAEKDRGEVSGGSGYQAPSKKSFERFVRGEELALAGYELASVRMGQRVEISNPESGQRVDAIVHQVTDIGDGRANVYVRKADDR